MVQRLKERFGAGNVAIIHGDCSGVDRAFKNACWALGVADEPHPADWIKGRGMGPKRNAEMVAMGATLCLAVHEDLRNSKGTLGCVRLALAANIPVWLVEREPPIGQPVAMRRIKSLNEI